MSGGARAYPCDGFPGMTWELALLLPPVMRFFIGLCLVLVMACGSALFVYWLYGHYGEDAETEQE